jgi:two-component system LytT family response regulator
MSKYRAIIIDDEQLCTKSLEIDSTKHCPKIEIVGIFHSSKNAIQEIAGLKPDVVYLDVEMPWMNGFEFLQNLQPLSFEVIFTTAYHEFAIEAFRANAIDYLLKPVETTLLIQATDKAINSIKLNSQSTNLEQLIQQMTARRKSDNLCIPTRDGFEFINTAQIVYCQSDNNYCIIHVDGEKSRVVTRTLKDIEAQLDPAQFLRTHQSYLINLDHVKGYSRADGGLIIMSDKTKLPVSRTKKEHVVERLKG